MNALAEIEKDEKYKEHFTFEIVPMNSDKGKASSDKFDWERQGHGLVILKPDGSLHAKLPGHAYADEATALITAELDKLLPK